MELSHTLKARAGHLMGALFRFRTYDVLERDLAEPLPDVSRDLPATLRQATAEDIQRLTWEGMHYDDARKQSAIESLQDGNLCVIAEHEGQVVHIGWVAFDQIMFPPHSMKIAPAWGYLCDTRTLPAFRGRGLEEASITERLRLAKERGAVRSINLTWAGDVETKDIYYSLGFQKFTSIRRARFMSKFWYEWNPEWLAGYLLDVTARPSSLRSAT